HVWQDAQHAESLRLRTAELRVPADADRRAPLEVQGFLDALDEAETPLQFLVGVYRVAKPRLISAMQYHMVVTDAVCDAPTIRVLRPIVAEEMEQVRWGEAAVEALIAGDPARAEHSARWQQHLEAILTAAGGIIATGTAQAPEAPSTPEVAMASLATLPRSQRPRSERLLIAARDARFYIDMTPRILPEDDDPPELLELEAMLADRRETSDLTAQVERRPADAERGLPPPVPLAQRDARFDMVHPAEQAARMPSPGDDWTEKARRLMHGMLDNEMHAAELSGRNTYEFPRMPWEFHLDMARVVWDEIRHSEETRKHLEDLGGQAGMYPVVPGNFGYRIQLDLLHRLQDLHRRGELGGLNGLLKSRNTFRDAGDEVGAKMFDFIQADETRHVAFGNRWVKWLLHDDAERLRQVGDEVEAMRVVHDTKVSTLVKQALGDTGEAKPGGASKQDDPTPVNIISLKIAGFSDAEIAELVQKGGGNAALE
ncbi:MAG: ferritin-like domain-containing protein, partial [Chloroflexota bacterium]|nr:ferritin-like domain-containing protein [Chloroflexota bacterium]